MTTPPNFVKQKELRRILAAAGPAERLVNLMASIEAHYLLIKPVLHKHAAFIDKVRFEGTLTAMNEEIQAQLAEHRKENNHD